MTREEKGSGARNRGVAQLSNEKLEKKRRMGPTCLEGV